MNAIAAGTVMVVGLTAAQCLGGGEGKSKPCDEVEVSDTVEAVASGDMIMLAKKDTVPVPYKTCVTLKAKKDTVPVP